jgi:tetratricopeptide (TPR) repeat protein
MRGSLLYAASLAAVVATGGYALAQDRAESSGPPGGRGEESTGDGRLLFPPENPFSKFDLDKLLALPGRKGDDSTQSPPPLSSGVKPPAGEAEQKSKAAQAEELRQALAPKPAPEAARKQMLDALFEHLRTASGPEEAQRIAESIERLWLQSPSDTANLLMQRATASAQAGQLPLALSLFDKLVVIEPNWAEAWNQRATTRFLAGDTDGAMADIGQVMKLEPRHFGALAGMGIILQGAGLDKSALEIFNKALVIYPLEPDIQKLVDKLKLEVEGQDI